MFGYVLHVDIYSAIHDDEAFDMGIDFDSAGKAQEYLDLVVQTITMLKDTDSARIGTIQNRPGDLSYVTYPNQRGTEVIRMTIVERLVG